MDGTSGDSMMGLIEINTIFHLYHVMGLPVLKRNSAHSP